MFALALYTHSYATVQQEPVAPTSRTMYTYDRLCSNNQIAAVRITHHGGRYDRAGRLVPTAQYVYILVMLFKSLMKIAAFNLKKT